MTGRKHSSTIEVMRRREKIFELLNDGKSQSDIMAIMDISGTTFNRHIAKEMERFIQTKEGEKYISKTQMEVMKYYEYHFKKLLEEHENEEGRARAMLIIARAKLVHQMVEDMQNLRLIPNVEKAAIVNIHNEQNIQYKRLEVVIIGRKPDIESASAVDNEDASRAADGIPVKQS